MGNFKIGEKIYAFIFGSLLIILAVIVIILFFMSAPEPDKPVIVGGIFIDTVEDNGWNETHYKGLKGACDMYNLQLEIEEHIEETPEATEPAVARLVKKGCSAIFLTSDGFGKDLKPILENYPDVTFYTISSDVVSDNAISYYVRIYQMRYLAGMIAGRMTKTGVLGYVAGANSPQVDRGLNAYLLGARSINPDVVVKVHYTNSWNDPEAEKAAAKSLIEDDNVDVMSYHESLDTAIGVAEEYGIYSIGYCNVSEKHSDKFLTACVYDWLPLYKGIVSDYLKGNVSNVHYYWWGGLYGVVDLSDFSPLVPDDIREKISEVKEQFNEGNDVFMGEIYRNDHTLMCEGHERISDDALLRKMNWVVEGVEPYE